MITIEDEKQMVLNKLTKPREKEYPYKSVLFYPMILQFRRTLISIILILPTLLEAQSNITQFFGTWERTTPNTVILEINKHYIDSIEFTMTSQFGNYYGFLGGYEKENSKYAQVVDSMGYFNDTGAISDGYPLYKEDEQPCKLWFKIIDENTMEVYEEDCYMIYGGAAITWGGEYERVKNTYMLAIYSIVAGCRNGASEW